MQMPLPILAAFTAGCLAIQAQEPRNWTDLKGRQLEGVLVKQDETTVWVRRGDGKELAIPKNSLSEADRKHLKDAPPAAAGGGQAGRFNNARIDPTAWKPRPDGFKLGTLVYPANLETEHFIIAGGEKVRPAMLAAYADAAERLWSDIAADYPALAGVFKGKRMAVLLLDGEADAEAFATWHRKHAEESPRVSPNYNLVRSSIAGFTIDEEFAGENGLIPTGRVFRLDSKTARHNLKTWPQRIHFIGSDIFGALMGSRPLDNGDYSLSMVRLVFSYHREEVVCGRIESEVSFGGGGSDVEGFKNGRNWAGATKKLLKAGAQPDIGALLETRGAKAEPRDLGFGLGLMHFIHADPARLAGFGEMLATTAKDKKCPDAETFAKSLGFGSTGALDAAWRDYMISDAFE